MENIEIFNQHLDDKTFFGKAISKFIAVECEFINCRFENLKIKDICFGAGTKKTRYINCSFDNSTFSSSVAGMARFENCSFKNVKIKKLFCVDIEMVNCIFSGELKKGNFLGVHHDINGNEFINEFHNNDFTDLVLGDVGFNNIDLLLQKLPNEPRFSVIYDVNNFILRAKSELEKVKGTEVFDSIASVINILELESEGGNNHLFVDKNSFPKKLLEGAEIVLSYRKE